MSSCTTVTISFELAGDENALVQEAQARLRLTSRRSREARAFLEAIEVGRCIGNGSKGQVVAWGCVGNYVSPDDFVGDLLPFLVKCWSTRLISQYAQVVVMFQREQQSSIEAYEIGLRNRSGVADPVRISDVCVRGGRIRFPVWDAIERQTNLYPDPLDDPLPPLDLEP